MAGPGPAPRPAHDLEDRLEARHHLYAAGDTDPATQFTWAVATALHDWGARDREDALIRDTLTRLSDDHPDRSNWIRQLADIAGGRGHITDATRLYQQAFALDERHVEGDPGNTGFQRDLSISYERLAENAGNTAEAAQIVQNPLEFCERVLGNTNPLTSAIRAKLVAIP
ncbi:MAG: hypothetical protein ACR2G2_17685 [Pseudonocardia sp.]